MDEQTKAPFFSVILPVYNREKMVSKAIESVISQDWEDWELIVVDDGSTDNTAEAVRAFLQDGRVRYICQENSERSAARNNGIAHANGRFICFIDSDDYYLPNHLRVLHAAITRNNFLPALYYTAYFTETGNERKAGKGYSEIRNRGLYNIMEEALLQTNSVCIEASLLEENRFPLEFNLFEDNHLWFRIIAKSRFVYIDQPTTVMCEHAERSLKVSKQDFRKKTGKYEAVLNDLFFSGKFPEIDTLVTTRAKRKFVAAKLLVLCYESMMLGMIGFAYRLLFRSVGTYFNKSRFAEYLKLFFGIPVFVTFMRRR